MRIPAATAFYRYAYLETVLCSAMLLFLCVVRYTTVIPAYSFGFGLSYTSWAYAASPSYSLLTPAHFSPNPPASASITIRFELANEGLYAGQEIVQVYSSYSPLTAPTAVQSIPRTELKNFTKIHVAAGETQFVSLQLNLSSLALVGPDGSMGVQSGIYLIYVGGAAPGSRGALVDGDDEHATVVQARMPDALMSSALCTAARQWWEDRLETDGEEGMAAVAVERAIAGGVVGVLTVC